MQQGHREGGASESSCLVSGLRVGVVNRSPGDAGEDDLGNTF